MKLSGKNIRNIRTAGLAILLTFQMGFVLVNPSQKLMHEKCCKTEMLEHSCCHMDEKQNSCEHQSNKSNTVGLNLSSCTCFEMNSNSNQYYLLAGQKDFSKELTTLLVVDLLSTEDHVSSISHCDINSTQLKIKPIFLINSALLI